MTKPRDIQRFKPSAFDGPYCEQIADHCTWQGRDPDVSLTLTDSNSIMLDGLPIMSAPFPPRKVENIEDPSKTQGFASEVPSLAGDISTLFHHFEQLKSLHSSFWLVQSLYSTAKMPTLPTPNSLQLLLPSFSLRSASRPFSFNHSWHRGTGEAHPYFFHPQKPCWM